MKLIRSVAIDATGILGVGLVAYGLSMWSIPSALVFVGVVLIMTAVGFASSTRPKPK